MVQHPCLAGLFPDGLCHFMRPPVLLCLHFHVQSAASRRSGFEALVNSFFVSKHHYCLVFWPYILNCAHFYKFTMSPLPLGLESVELVLFPRIHTNPRERETSE